MTIADASIVVLIALFVATLIPAFDLGLAALAAAFVLGALAGVSADDVTAFFPADFFVLIVGVTAMFGAAQLNGTLDWILDLLLRLVRGKLVLVVLVPFVIGAVLTAIGTLPAAATAIVSPIALGLATRYRISPFVAAVLGISGIISGLLSPLAVYGVSARELSDDQGLELPGSAPVTFLGGGLLAGLVVCAAFILIASRNGAIPRERVDVPARPSAGGSAVQPGTPQSPTGTGRATSVLVDAPATTASVGARMLTMSCLAAVVVLSVGFDMNVGYLGVMAALILQIVLRLEPGAIVAKIPWGVVLLIGGLLTYVGLMEHLGAFERISNLLRVEGSPMLTLLVVCYIAGITSFAASSIAVFVTALPLLPPLVADGVSPVGGVLALALASVLVDLNPLGITGGLILGAAEPSARARLFRQLLTYGLISVAVAPAVAWAAFSWW